MKSLYSANSPQRFWRCLINLPNEQWQTAIERSLHLLPETFHNLSSVGIIAAVLGELQFGENHWTLGTSRRLYYTLKPFLPRSLTKTLRKLISNQMREDSTLDWPVEKRYVHFQWEAMAMQIPVVTTPVAGIPELVHDGENGILVPERDINAFADAIELLISNDNIRHGLGKRGREKVCKGFDINKTTAKLSAIIRLITVQE